MKKNALPFGKTNYIFMLAGVALILLGFLTMSMDKAEFGFGTLGLTVGPLLVLSGFVVALFAIFRKA